jgi:hypothetical protein
MTEIDYSMNDLSTPRTGVISPLLTAESSDNLEKWRQIRSTLLMDWQLNRNSMGDDETSPPTLVAVGRAAKITEEMMKRSFPAPHQMLLDPNGGIVMSRSLRSGKEVIQIWDDGSAEYMSFRDGRLVNRSVLTIDR